MVAADVDDRGSGGVAVSKAEPVSSSCHAFSAHAHSPESGLPGVERLQFVEKAAEKLPTAPPYARQASIRRPEQAVTGRASERGLVVCKRTIDARITGLSMETVGPGPRNRQGTCTDAHRGASWT
jgi:hypothetical protein